jgi:hypothetical protein
VNVTPGKCDVQDVRAGDWMLCEDGAARVVVRAGWVPAIAGDAVVGAWVVVTSDRRCVDYRHVYDRPTARVEVLAAS